jgi:hypothetical protein
MKAIIVVIVHIVYCHPCYHDIILSCSRCRTSDHKMEKVIVLNPVKVAIAQYLFTFK